MGCQGSRYGAQCSAPPEAVVVSGPITPLGRRQSLDRTKAQSRHLGGGGYGQVQGTQTERGVGSSEGRRGGGRLVLSYDSSYKACLTGGCWAGSAGAGPSLL